MFLPILYGVAFLLTFISPYLSVCIYVLLLFYYALPGPSVIRWITGHRARSTARRLIEPRQAGFHRRLK
jgi:hypothetical protein